MFINDVQKGMRIQMTCIPQISDVPRFATVHDKPKGVIRTVLVDGRDGYDEEAGSAWIDEIVAVHVDGVWEPVEITPAQRTKLREDRGYERAER